MTKMNATVKTCIFNANLAIWLKKYLKSKNPSVFKVMLKANELWAESHGHYPERDEDWIKDLCSELNEAISFMASEQMNPEEKETQDLQYYFYVCKLNAKKFTEMTGNF